MPDTPPALFPPPDVPTGTGASLFLDFDGTLVTIADRHDGVVVDAGLRLLVAGLARRLNGRLAIVSGRPAHEIRAYLHEAADNPPFAIAGSHGLELCWTDGRRETPRPSPQLGDALGPLHDFAARHPGVVVEEKPFGAALHYRLAPQAEKASEALAETIARETGFVLQRGKMVIEIKTHAADKGDAVRRFMAEPPMAGTRPVFVGDDLTDEAGFAAAAALGGFGILAGGTRGTAARYRLDDVGAVRGWLARIAGQQAGADA